MRLFEMFVTAVRRLSLNNCYTGTADISSVGPPSEGITKG